MPVETVVPAENVIETDHALVERVARGDERAVQALVDRHGGALFAYASLILRDPADAEEVVADAFLQAWRTASTFDPVRGSVIAWLAMITRSRARDRLRARRPGRTLIQPLEPGARFAELPGREEPTPEREYEATETRDLVGRALCDLPEPQRRVIELAYFGGLSQSEIADRLAVPLGTVKTRTLAALKRLRDLLAPLLREEVA